MSKFMDKLKDAMGLGDEYEDDDYENEEQKPEETHEKPERKWEESKPVMPVSAERTTARQEIKTEVTRQTVNGRSTVALKMIVIEPQGFEESPRLVDSLKAKKPIIINLENLETDIARKIFDFLSGATYALNGKVQKVANNIFVFAPENVDVTYKDVNKQEAPQEPSKSPWGK